MAKGFTVEDVVELLRKDQGDRTQREFAVELGISQQYLCDVMNGRRNPGPSLLKRFGLMPGFIKSDRAA